MDVKMKKLGTRLSVALVMISYSAVFTLAMQMQSGKDHISFKPVTATAKAGDTITVTVNAKIDKHWHTYGTREVVNAEGMGPLPTTFSIKSGTPVKLVGKPRITKGMHSHYDSVWMANIDELAGAPQFELRLAVSKSLQKDARVSGALEVELQMCDTVSCLPPEVIEIPLNITISEAFTGTAADVDETVKATDSAVATASAAQLTADRTTGQPPAPAPRDAEIEAEKSRGLLSFFFYAMGVGFLALLTPCVFPMIPITVSFFTKRHEKSKGKGLRDSVTFGLGIITTFTAVGIIASIIFGGAAVQNLAADPLLNMAIAGVFIVLAFNLFGAFEIQVPTSIMNKLNRKAQGNSLSSVWLMGFVFSLTSFTCTVPFVGTLLLSASQASSVDAYIYPAVGTLGFATAFAFPFVLLSMFPALLARMPRAGGWMNNLKVVMGFIELAAAVKFISNADLASGWGVLPREVFLSIWAGVCFITALYVLGVFEMKLDSRVEKVSAVRVVFATIFATFTFWFAAGLTGSELGSFVEALLPPENYQELMDKTGSLAMASDVTGNAEANSQKDDKEKLVWADNLEKALVHAKELNKPVFIDFTGFTCTNCRLMEKYVFSKPPVLERFKKFVLVQLYTDRRTEPFASNQQILATYGTIANPLYVILRPDGSFVAKSGYLPKYQSDPATFVEFLDKAFAPAQS